MFHFRYPYMLLLLLIVAALPFIDARIARRSFAFSSVSRFAKAGLDAPWWKRKGRTILRMATLAFLVLALARPQTGRSEYRIETHGVDIMLVLDTSGSMQAQDFEPKNRLHVAKEVVKDFISRRKSDRIGLVVFAGQAMTQCPLTLDHDLLAKLVDDVHFGMLEDRTAIGVALATACNRLKKSNAKSRVVVLLTDGQNNAGSVDPPTAARVARALGIKVYTIGVGTKGVAPVPVDDPIFGRRLVAMKVDLDEDTLKQIAETTGGKYFRATNPRELREIYDKIDSLEKTKIESKAFVSYTDRYTLFAAPALGFLLIELLLGAGALREIP